MPKNISVSHINQNVRTFSFLLIYFIKLTFNGNEIYVACVQQKKDLNLNACVLLECLRVALIHVDGIDSTLLSFCPLTHDYNISMKLYFAIEFAMGSFPSSTIYRSMPWCVLHTCFFVGSSSSLPSFIVLRRF